MRGLFTGKSGFLQSRKIEKLLQKAKEEHDNKDYSSAFETYSKAATLQSTEAEYRLGLCYLNGQGVAINLHAAALWFEKAANAGWLAAAYSLALLHIRGLPEIKEEIEGNNFFDAPKTDFSNLKPDIEKAIYWAKVGAEEGNAEAQALYAYLISENTEDQVVIEEALEWYDKSIAQDSNQGYMGKGILLLKCGENVEDYQQAAKYLEIAAERKMGTACFKLGVMYATGRGVTFSLERAAALYKDAAELGIREAQALYGVALKKGEGVEQNFILAETWLRKAALGGDIEAAVVLGDMNSEGNAENPPNFIEALKWYGLAAESGHVTATRALGNLYLRGLGTAKNVEKAVQLLELAASNGDVIATITLGDVAIQIPNSGLELDKVIKEYLEPNAEKGNAAVMFNLAVALLRSNSINPDPEKETQARQWLRRSCDEIMVARYWYGRMLIQGKGGPQESEEGYAWISSAAHEGIVDAQILWANILLEGKTNDGEALAEEALKFFKMAAERGSVPAMFSIGALYGGGNHLKPNRELAQEWFIKAAERRHPQAQLMLGRYYLQGLAGEKDLKKAIYWYEQSASLGDPEATEELKQITSGEAQNQATKNSSTEVKQSTDDGSNKSQLQDQAQNDLKNKELQNNVEVAPGLFFKKKK